MRPVLPVLLIVLACGSRERPSSAPDHAPSAAANAQAGHGSAPTASPAIDDAQLAKLLAEADAPGAALVTDVASGAVIASAAVERDLAAAVLPLSVVKLYTAALWWELDRGDGELVERGQKVTVHDVLVDGWDRPGEVMAVELRRVIGGYAMLAELIGYGLGDGLTLPENADDARWGSALSLGEHDVQVTLPRVAEFLRAIGGGTEVLHPRTQHKLQAAMRDAVERGTAKSARARLVGGDWRLGGKTGTGPADANPRHGWFAGLIFERDKPRYAIAVYIERRGPGGGVAAGLAAEVTRLVSRASR